MNNVAYLSLLAAAGLGLVACTVNTAPPVATTPAPVVVEQPAPRPPSAVLVQPAP